MTIDIFLKLVEIQTKVASMIPFILGTLYTLYRFDNFNLKNFLMMLISLLTIDMTTTAINNYIDYKKAIKKHGFNYESHNAIVKYKLKESQVIFTIILMLIIASIFGILLFLNTKSLVILLLGGISFLVGVFYSFGPIPISRTPFGEIFSGFFMGFIIFFIATFIHIYDKDIVTLIFKGQELLININFIEVLYIFLVSIPCISGIANIMLANNICDIDDDIENKRYTLPIYVGKEKALNIFRLIYYIIYIDIVILLIFKIAPISVALVLITIIPVNKHNKVYFDKQTKKDTFVLAVKNFVLVNVVYIVSIGIGILIDIL